MISKKSFVINGSREKEILLDISYLENQSPKSIVIFSHGFKGFKDWGPFNQMANSFAESNFFFIKFGVVDADQCSVPALLWRGLRLGPSRRGGARSALAIDSILSMAGDERG